MTGEVQSSASSRLTKKPHGDNIKSPISNPPPLLGPISSIYCLLLELVFHFLSHYFILIDISIYVRQLFGHKQEPGASVSQFQPAELDQLNFKMELKGSVSASNAFFWFLATLAPIVTNVGTQILSGDSFCYEKI